MTSITVGLVPAPGMPRTLIEKIIDELPELTEKYIDADCIFKFELEVSPLASSAEYINETIHRMAKIKKKNDWDYVIGITDLPSLSENRVVVSEFDSQKSVSLISLPALGFFL